MPSKRTVRLGSTEVDISTLVRDPRGIEDMVADDLESDYQEARFKNFNQKMYPFADAADLAEWDGYLMTRYPPLYLNFDAMCTDCPMGPCNLKMAVGHCGLDGASYQARLSLRKTCRGCLSQVTDNRQTLDHAIKIVGPDATVTWGEHHDRSDASHIGLMTAMWPRTVRDLAVVAGYVEAQIAKLLFASYNGHDSGALEGMALHAGSMLMVSMDVSELLRTNFFGFNNASDHELTDMANWPPTNVLGGLGSLQPGKPVLTFMGDAFLSSWYAVKQLKEAGLADKVEMCGIGSVAHDIVRFYSDARILGPMTAGSKLISYGVSDVIVASTACINWDFMPEARKAGTKVIWTGTESALGLPDQTDDAVEKTVDGLLGAAPGAWIRDVEKAAQVAVRLVTMLKRKPMAFMSDEQVKAEAGKCRADCDKCSNVCPNGLLVGQALRKAATQGIAALKNIEDGCYSCGHCQVACPEKLRLDDMIMSALSAKAPDDKLKMRAGRGPVSRTETTSWAFGSLMGNCPGIFHIFGCGDAKNRGDLGDIAYELTWRNGIVFTAGCAAGDIGRHFNKNKGKYLFDEFGAEGQPRNIMNCGACSGCAHVIDQALKWPRSGAGISHYGNFAETADTCHNLIAPTAIVWGALTDRMYAIVAAWVRGGISVIVGPDSAFSWKRAMVHSKWRWEDSFGYSVLDGRKMYVDPTPSSMIMPVETKEEAVTYAMALSMRAADIRDTRQIRLETYIELFSKLFGDFPDDWQLYVRSDWELPLRFKSRMLRILRETYGWDIDRLKVKHAKHPDGRLLDMGDFGHEYGSMAFPSTKLLRLVSRKGTLGTAKQEVNHK